MTLQKLGLQEKKKKVAAAAAALLRSEDGIGWSLLYILLSHIVSPNDGGAYHIIMPSGKD